MRDAIKPGQTWTERNPQPHGHMLRDAYRVEISWVDGGTVYYRWLQSAIGYDAREIGQFCRAWRLSDA